VIPTKIDGFNFKVKESVLAGKTTPSHRAIINSMSPSPLKVIQVLPSQIEISRRSKGEKIRIEGMSVTLLSSKYKMRYKRKTKQATCKPLLMWAFS
jgi:hypothetical protein